MDLILTDVQILGIIMCAVLSFVAYRIRVPSLALVPSVGFFILGYQIFDAAQDPLLLILFWVTAIASFTICFRSER